MNKKSLTEADIRTKFITPALVGAKGDKWNVMTQIREEVFFTKGRVIVRGKTVKRGEAKKADYLLGICVRRYYLGRCPGLAWAGPLALRHRLPPHAEQRRIVAKVKQLMALVDALETQLAAARATAANLLTALVAELTTRANGASHPSPGQRPGKTPAKPIKG